jgi:hypothetical protein
MAVSSRGTVVVATEGGIALFDATTLEPLPPVRIADTDGLRGRLALAPDGRSLALLRTRAPLTTDAQLIFTDGFGEDSLVLVDLVRGRERGEVPLPEHPFSFEYAPDGSIAVGTTNGRLILVDPRSQTVTASSPKVADGFLADVLFTDFGILVSERSGVVSILDTATLRPAGRTLQEPGEREGSLLALRNGHELLTSYSSGLVTSFDLRPAALLRHACTVAASGLPDSYWRGVLPDREPIPPCG